MTPAEMEEFPGGRGLDVANSNATIDDAIADSESSANRLGETTAWLEMVLPPEGAYCLAHSPNGGSFKQDWFSSPQKLADAALKIASLGEDCWFAVASFDGTGSRKAERAVKLLTLIADVDVDAEGGNSDKYETLDAARKALAEFEALFLPATSVVCSGYGLHVYWVFHEPLTPEQWKPLALRFKAYMKATGFRTDPKRTADAASLLRIPFTRNCKNLDNPRPVVIEHAGWPLALSDIEAKLSAAQLPASKTQRASALPVGAPREISHHWFDKLSADEKLQQLDKLYGVLGAEYQDSTAKWEEIMAASSCVIGLTIEKKFEKFEEWSCQQKRWREKWQEPGVREKIRERFSTFNKSNVGVLINLARVEGYRPPDAALQSPLRARDRFGNAVDAGAYLKANYVFVDSEGAYRQKDGSTLLKPDTFVRVNAALMPLAQNGRAVSADLIAMERGFVERVHNVAYLPGEKLIFQESGRSYLNLWKLYDPPPIKPTPRFLTALKNLLAHLKNSCEDTGMMLRHFVRSLAYLVQNPRERLRQVLLLIGEIEGSGKSTLLLIIPRLLFGVDNVGLVSNGEAASAFNSWVTDRRIVSYEEIALGTRKDSEQRANDLKAIVTDDYVRVHRKGKDGYQAKNVTSIFATSNHIDAAYLSTSDRRWAVAVTTAPRLPDALRKELFEQLNLADASGMLTYMFQHLDISGFDPHSAPPLSKAKQRVIETSRDDIQLVAVQAWENENGVFARDIVSLEDVCVYIADKLGRSISPKFALQALQKAPINATPVSPSKRLGDKTYTKRAWTIRKHDRWAQAGTTAQYEEFHRKP